MKHTMKKPSYYLLSQAMDGDEKAIEKILAFYDPYLSLIHISTNRYIGYLPDVPEFYSFMTAREYLRLCGESLEMGKNDIEKRSDELLTCLLYTSRCV